MKRNCNARYEDTIINTPTDEEVIVDKNRHIQENKKDQPEVGKGKAKGKGKGKGVAKKVSETVSKGWKHEIV